MIRPITHLGEHIDIQSGFAFKSQHFNTEGRGLPLVRIRDVQPGRSNTFYDGDFDEQFIIDDGDLLIGMDGEFNRERWRGGRGLLNQRVCKITAKSGRISMNYLYHLLPQILRDIEDKTPFVTVKHLSAKTLRSVEVPLPTLNSQERIAAILDKADAIRSKRRQALAAIDALLRGTFLNMFGDPRSVHQSKTLENLGDVCDFYSGSTLPRAEEFKGQSGGLLVIKVAELNMPENQSVVTVARGWTATSHKREGIVAPAGAIVFPKRGGAISTNKKRILGRSAYLDPNLMAVAPKQDRRLSSNYMRAWFELFDLESISSGSAVPQLNKKDLAPLKIFMPSADALKKFDAVANAIGVLRLRATLGLEESDTLFGSLSNRAFGGDF